MFRHAFKPLIPKALLNWRSERIREARKQGAWERELARLRALPRYAATTTEISGLRTQVPDGASFVEMYEEVFERQMLAFRCEHDAPHIIDGGANVGLVTLYYKQVFPRATVVAFEPDEHIFAALSQNVQQWGLRDVELHRLALGAEEATLQFMAEGSYAGRVARTGDRAQATVHAVSLRPWLERPVDLLKLNIEGAETEVVVSCADLLPNVRSAIVEYHSFASEPQRLAELLGTLRGGGFRVHINPVRRPLPQPLMQREIVLGMDLQLALYAYRP